MLEMLSKGISWAGQLPLRKRSGKVFMAFVTKSPLYEDEDLVGIVTNASDVTLFTSTNSVRTQQEQAIQAGGRKISWTPEEQNSQPGECRKISWTPQEQNSQTGGRKINWDKFQCRIRARIAAVPHIAAPVSNLVLIYLYSFFSMSFPVHAFDSISVCVCLSIRFQLIRLLECYHVKVGMLTVNQRNLKIVM